MIKYAPSDDGFDWPTRLTLTSGDGDPAAMRELAIRNAAPELYAALKRYDDGCMVSALTDPQDCQCAGCQTRRAIAKAEGRMEPTVSPER